MTPTEREAEQFNRAKAYAEIAESDQWKVIETDLEAAISSSLSQLTSLKGVENEHDVLVQIRNTRRILSDVRAKASLYHRLREKLSGGIELPPDSPIAKYE